MTFQWRQEGDRIIVTSPKGEYYFIFNEDVDLMQIHVDLRYLVEYILFGAYYPDSFAKPMTSRKWSREGGVKIGLAFSTGLDSTAAMLLLPKNTILSYHQRGEYLGGVMCQDNALRMIDKMTRKVQIVQTNIEKIPVDEGKTARGAYPSDMAVAVGLVLSADLHDLGYIATGTMLGSTYVRKGWAYQEFQDSSYWKKWKSVFDLAGLRLIFPVGGLSEVLTHKIVMQSKYSKLARSCIRGINGKDCGICYKCFRKHMLNGIKPKELLSFEADYYLNKKPLKQGDSMIYAYQKSKTKIDLLEPYKDIDVSWSERYYDQAFELTEPELVKNIKAKLHLMKIKPMIEKDIQSMKEFNIK